MQLLLACPARAYIIMHLAQARPPMSCIPLVSYSMCRDKFAELHSNTLDHEVPHAGEQFSLAS